MKWIKSLLILTVSLLLAGSVYADLVWTGCGISKKAYMSEIAKSFKQTTGINIDVSGGGATKGIRDTAANKSDLGGSCRHLILAPEERGVKLHPVGWDALVAIVNPNNPVSDITVDNLKAVFSGQIKNWKELGGPDQAIDVLVREGKISGVGMMSRELIFGDADADFMGTKEFPSTGPLEKEVESNQWAIGLDGISSAKKSKVKILTLNGVESSVENIASGKYLLYRPLYLVTSIRPKPEVKKFISYIKSDEGQAVIASQGTVTLAQGQNLWEEYRANMRKVKGENKGVFE